MLDIKEDDEEEAAQDGETKLPKSKTMPSIASTQEVGKVKQDESVWGSFNGSFFENKPASNSPITNAPPKKTTDTSSGSKICLSEFYRSHNNIQFFFVSLVESLEIISRTNSTLPSPADVPESRPDSQSTVPGSESVEVIFNKTPSIVDLTSPSDVDFSSPVSPESIELTTSSDVSSSIDELPSIPTLVPTKQPSIDESSTMMSISDNTLTTSDTSFCDLTTLQQTHQLKSPIMEKSMESFEIQTQVSDSTHSFEEIHNPLHRKAPSSAAEPTKKNGSGQNSGDELETATSSDIEIISSPNGDSSSTASCNKLTLKGDFAARKCHSRELSEISVLSLNSDDSTSISPGGELERCDEKLMKRIQELSETLEQREFKLMQMGRNNAELVEANTKLVQEIDAMKKGRGGIDMSNIQEEYTQRLSALEKKFQQSIRDNAQLKKQIEQMKSEMESKVSRLDYEKMQFEKDSMIETLKNEGEKLSKQILQHSTVTKKLRTKLKEYEESTKRNETQINELTEENSKMKKLLATKEEIEKSQSDGINKLTGDKRRFERENSQLKNQVEDLQSKLNLIQNSHENMRKESSDKAQETIKNLTEDKEKAANESRALAQELAEMRTKLREVEGQSSQKEQKLRLENLELKQKLEETEFRIEDQKQEASLASIPLIRQLESLQSTLNSRTKSWENQEKLLLEKIEDAESKLKSHNDIDRSSRDQVTQLNIKISNLEEKLSSTSLKLEQKIGALQQKEIESQLQSNDYKMKIDHLTMDLNARTSDAEKFKSLVSQLEEKLRLAREEFEEEKRKNLFVQQQNQNIHHHHNNQDQHEMGNVSPTMSLGSIESIHSHPWNLDDTDAGANSTYSSQYGGVVNSSASLMEGLQSVLKQRDGEVQQLQWEIQRLQVERNFLQNEMSSVAMDLEKVS